MRLYMTHESKIRGYVLCKVNNWTDTDDIMQEAVLVLMKKFQAFDSAQGFLNWALRVAQFEVLNHSQKKKNHLPLFSPAVQDRIDKLAAREVLQQDVRREALKKCITKLRKQDQELLRLRYELDATTKRVAQAVGRSTDAVYKALNRIQHQLLLCIRRSQAQEARV